MNLRFKTFIRYIGNLSTTSYSFESKILPALEAFTRESNHSNCTVVDFGCSSKPYSFIFKEFKGKYVGIDVYPGPEVDIVYDGLNLPFENASIDLIFSSSVFEHVEDLERSLFEIGRVLKPGGKLLAVVPFISHLHSTPYDFHRPTLYGWETKLNKSMGNCSVSVTPVDSRLNCLTNLITSQINLFFLDLLRYFYLLRKSNRSEKSIVAGDASPEGGSSSKLKLVYLALELNPVNFLLGLFSFLCSFVPLKRRSEGQITTGYYIEVNRR